ncbi:Ser/Thr protein kinase [Moritella sp. Urea-trap-13]|nr:Ser/Thr protein kinase [Moritella sp. Urea-trap-13]
MTKGFLSLCIILMSSFYSAASIAKPLSYWDKSNLSMVQDVDHSQWQHILNSYLIVGEDSTAMTLFNYQGVTSADKIILKQYLTQLQSINPLQHTKVQQQAYWINLYNALTVQLILDNYPVKSITKLGERFFSFGPWDDDATVVNGKTLSLNDIEHEILRPIWQDPRIHYAVNCASYGCPNLSASAFTASNIEALLTAGAYAYINHPRGVTVKGNDLEVSSIYKWYSEDFGDNEKALIEHLQRYAKPELKQALQLFQQSPGDIDYEYDWRLNKAE